MSLTNSLDNPNESLNSVPTESYIIGSVLNDYAVLDELMTQIPPQMFSNSLHQELWQTLCEMRLNDKPLDLASVITEAPQTVKAISVNRLMAMQKSVIGRSGLEHHLKRLTEMYIRREVIKGANQLARGASDINITVDQLMSGYEQIAMSIAQASVTQGLHAGDTYAQAWLDELKRRSEDPSSGLGFITGWVDLDEMTLGWHRQELVVVGGRTSIGKSAFAIENIIRMLLTNRKTAVFSLEMSEYDVRNRIAANISGIPYGNMRKAQVKKDELGLLKKQMDLMSRLAITDERGMSTEAIIAQMKRWKRQKGLDFVVIDYLQEIEERSQKNDNGGSALKRIVQKLRKAAKDCDCCVMALSQLTRDAEGKKPTLADLSGSSGIENVADITILLHRNRKEEEDLMLVDVAKDRNGKTGEVQMTYQMSLQRIQADRDRRNYIEPKEEV